MAKLMERLEGRDRISSIKISQKVNELIEKVEELANELVEKGVLEKE